MNHTILLIVSMAASLLASLAKKFLTDRYENSASTYHFYNALVSLTSAAALFALSGVPSVSLFTVLLALAFGLVTALQQITSLQALENGPFSYTTVILSLSTLIPTLSGAIFWHETIVPVQIIGILLLLVCFVLSVDLNTEKKAATLRWILFCAVAFLCTGMIGVMQKWHQSSAFKNELDGFLIIAFAFSFLYSAANWFLLRKKDSATSDTTSAKKPLFTPFPIALMLISGICVAANNKLNLFLSGVIDSAIFFPVVNGGNLILVTLAACLLFRERPTLRQWIGILFGIASVLLLCNPF